MKYLMRLNRLKLALLMAIFLTGGGYSSFIPQVLADTQVSSACPDGICPGLGNGFYLSDTNAFSIQTGGRVFFNNRKLGECATLSAHSESSRNFNNVSSMKEFVENSSAKLDIGGGYNTGVLSIKGSAKMLTGHDSKLTSSFHSTHMDIVSLKQVVDLKDDKACRAESNLDKGFLGKFNSLTPITSRSVGNPSAWNPYVQFLRNYGSHIMTQQGIGSLFQQWESDTASGSEVGKQLQIKACAQVEGLGTSGGWSVSSCGAYSKEQKQKASQRVTSSKRQILGSSKEARDALILKVNAANLQKFLKDANQADQAVQFKYKPIWELLYAIYQPKCASDGKGSESCKSLQRAVNLQAAYEGWLGVECTERVTSNGHKYQAMNFSDKNDLGIQTFECTAYKTGCVDAKTDCHAGGVRACYCYGASCIEEGAPVIGTDYKRNTIRTTKEGGHGDGVNRTCSVTGFRSCKCNRDKVVSPGQRDLYQQAMPR